MKEKNIYENEFWSEQKTMRPGGMQLTKELFSGIETQGRILDIGCGEGGTVNELISGGMQAVGIDVSDYLIERALEQYPHGAFLKGDGKSLPFGEASYSIALCECSLTAIENKKIMLKEIYRILEDHGRVIISDVYVKKDSKREETLWSLDMWKKVLLETGFVDVTLKDRNKEWKAFILEAVWNHKQEELKGCLPQGYKNKELGYFSLVAVKEEHKNVKMN
jgi:ubiquinone/menaquinone biosynthesis C-methylase UbiE